MRKEPIRNFIQHAIGGLSKENFDELIKLFQEFYWNNTAVIVDGTNDGGCDIKVFQNRREIKKCIQVTVQKHIEGKIKSDLNKVNILVNKYGYARRFEFYCTITVSNSKIEEYKKFASDSYNIELEIYDAQRLSQLKCKQVEDYIYTLHKDVVLRPEEINITKMSKSLYDLLAYGKDTLNIKNSLVESIIVAILYENGAMDLVSLKEELENRLGKKVPDISSLVIRLKTDQRVVKDKLNDKKFLLSDDEIANVKDILSSSTQEEKSFISSLSAILAKYGIEYNDVILYKLKSLYKVYYSMEEGSRISNGEDSFERIFGELKAYLKSNVTTDFDINQLISDTQKLCLENVYLNKICASESFLSLYQSDKLEIYLNQRQKYIYLDTPAFIYLLCDTYGIENNDWGNPFYRSMKGLIRLQKNLNQQVRFVIMADYLYEVVGEIKKALQISKFENSPFFFELGETRNTLYNYYLFLKKHDMFFEKDDIASFTDFLYCIGFDNQNPDDTYFNNNTLQNLREITDDLNIDISEAPYGCDDFAEIKTKYCEYLYDTFKREKSNFAIKNDINQVISLSLLLDDGDVYLTTWDTTLPWLRDCVINRYNTKGKYRYFYISNPARLSNKIALGNFNIDKSALTNDIFAYADKRYDISNRVKSLLELIAPYWGNSDTNGRLLRDLSKIRKQQLEDEIDYNSTDNDKNLPIEEVLIRLIPSKEQIHEDKDIVLKFSQFISSESNIDYILELVNNMLESDNYSQYDLNDYYKHIQSFEI